MDIFANAPKAATKTAAKGKKDTVVVETKGLELYAALKVVEDNVKAQRSVVEVGVKEQMTQRFIDEGIKLGKKPESYKGEENGTTGSLQFKCLPNTSALSDETQAMLKERDIPMKRVVSKPQTFIFNPAYADLSDKHNKAIFDAISKVLAPLMEKGIVPRDLIQQQDEESKMTADEDTIAAVFKLKTENGEADRETIEAMIPLVSCLAIRPSLAEGANAFEIVDKAMNIEDAEVTAAA